MVENLKVRICSYNVNGMLDFVKRCKIFNLMKHYKIDIALLQETHASASVLKLWQSEWGGKIYSAHSEDATKGVMILIDRNSQCKVKEITADNEGRLLIAEIEINEIVYIFVNIYAPNVDRPDFFVKVTELIDSFDNCNIVWCGDFNLVLNVTVDRYNSKYNNVRAANVLLDTIEKLELKDVWRIQNPDLSGFTWRRGNAMSRIDFILINAGLLPSVQKTFMQQVPLSDHSPVFMHLSVAAVPRGPGFWMLNTSHLSEENLLTNLNQVTEKIVQETCYSMPHERCETIKFHIRSFCIRESKEIARKRKLQLEGLLDEMQQLELKLQSDPEAFLLADQDRYVQTQDKIQEFMDRKAKGCILRCKVQWHAQGRRSSKYFFSLEKSKANRKKMKCLQKSDGTLIHNQQAILNEQFLFYKELYQRNDQVEFNITVPDSEIKLTQNQTSALDNAVELEEMTQALFSMPNNKTPGCDGLPAELYIQDIVVKTFRSIHEHDN